MQNLEIIKVDVENNLILVKGNVPGANKSLVFIKTSVKQPGAKKEAVELVTYKVADVVETEVEEEIVEEVATETEESSQEEN